MDLRATEVAKRVAADGILVPILVAADGIEFHYRIENK
jgi:hypothetical protein